MVGVPRSKACITCRERRKGCDRRRPGCGQCQRMGLECKGYARELIFVHATKQQSSPSKIPATAPRGALAAGSDRGSSWFTYTGNDKSSPRRTVNSIPGSRTNNFQSLWRTDVSPEAYPGSATSETRRQLGLGLMSRWAAATHTSFCFLGEDASLVKQELPRWGLEHRFLLHGILAMSSLDIALRGSPGLDSAHQARHVRVAMEHYNMSSASFRAQLRDIRHDNIHILWMYSYMAIVINLALFEHMDATPPGRMLQSMTNLLELFIGCSSLGDAHMDWLLKSPVGAPAVRANVGCMTAVNIPLERTVDTALTRLMSVASNGVSIVDAGGEGFTLKCLDSHQKAVAQLRDCFAISLNSEATGFCGEFLTLAGREFMQGVRDSDPVALFILLHWAVLLQSIDTWNWWAKPFGRILVHKISDTLVQSHPQLTSLQEWQEGIAWARQNSLD